MGGRYLLFSTMIIYWAGFSYLCPQRNVTEWTLSSCCCSPYSRCLYTVHFQLA